jgi:pimeloyl-ACP methyl ester carboxylesterase
MNAKWKRGALRALFVLIVIYFLAGLLLYFTQDLFLFHPRKLSRDHQFRFSQPFIEENILIDGRNLNIIKFQPRSKPKGVVLFFHGNMENIEHYNQYVPIFTGKDYSLWMVDYPGFGKSTGKRTEERMYRDAIFIYEQAIKQFDPSQISIYGKSIGTGVASYLASVKIADQLILESPYYSIEALASHYLPVYPVSLLTNYSFPIHAYLQRSKMRTTIFHGTDDEVVPYAQSVKLVKENPNIELVTIKGGKHNNLAGYPSYIAKLDSLFTH